MSYAELIVVLGIFSIMSSIVLFNYGAFQAKVDIKSLANDIALKIVEAQKSALSGKLPPNGQVFSASWKPSYGVYFYPTTDNKSFIFFTDLETSGVQNGVYDTSSCPGTSECLEQISITKGNYVSSVEVIYQNDPTTPYPLTDLTITFKRPNSAAVISSSTSFASAISYVQINITSPRASTNNTAKIKVYPSGRVQVN